MLILKFIVLVLLFFSFSTVSHSGPNSVDVCLVWSNDWKFNPEIRSLIRTNVQPLGGSNAGKIAKVHVTGWDECVRQCCQFDRCNVAYWLGSQCFHIECSSDEMCQPIKIENDHISQDILFLQVRSVHSTAAALDYDDLGFDQCNETHSCPKNEKCETVAINAQLKRNVCLCDRISDFRRIKGVCRQYLPRARPCAIYEIDYESDRDTDDDNDTRGKCRKNEECLPPTDRAKHGYCQCKIGFTRTDINAKCVIDDGVEPLANVTKQFTTESTSVSLSDDFIVNAGNDQTIALPINEVNLNGRVTYKINKTNVDASVLNSKNLTLIWSLKSSDNEAKVDISNQERIASHITIKQLREGTYAFELKLIDQQGIVLSSDIVKVEVLAKATTPPPLVLKIDSPIKVHLPQKVIELKTAVEPSSRHITYQWTYKKDGPVVPAIDESNPSKLLISNIRAGSYSFQLDVTDELGNKQTKTIQLIVTGEPIEARVAKNREIVFWPSNDVLLDGSPSIVEEQTQILWTFISNDNKQDSNSIQIISPNSLKTRVSNLRIGQYKFQLMLVTNDKQYTSKAEVLVVVYGQNGQPPQISIQLKTQDVNILNNLIILDASLTTADYGVAKWQWKKSATSPAMGHFINDSNFSPIVYVTNLVEGQYVFNLQVSDDRQQISETSVTVNVSGVPDAKDLVEIKFAPKSKLYHQILENLLAQIRVFLIDLFPNIHVTMVGMLKEDILLVKGTDFKSNMVISPKTIANHLQNKISSIRSASNVNIVSIDTYACLSTCSDHGQCDQKTKRCVCNRHYMENWFKSFIYREPNCDFIILYFVLIATLGPTLFIIFCCFCCCCCLRWRRRRKILERRKRIRYQLLQDDDEDEGAISLMEKQESKSRSSKKNKAKKSNIVISTSDQSEDNDEQTLYDKPLLTAKMQMHSPNLRSRGLKVAVQDTNSSPVVPDNVQLQIAPEHSLA